MPLRLRLGQILTLWLLMVAPLVPRLAGAEARWHAIVLANPDSELAQRIVGQTSDLALQLDIVAPPEGRAPERKLAEELGRAHAADAVLWLSPLPNEALAIYVLDRGRDQLRTRAVSAPSASHDARATPAASAMAEVAALVVRGELSSMFKERAAPAPSKAPAPSPPPMPPEAKPAATRPPQQRGPARSKPDAARGWLASLGYRAALPLAGEVSHAATLALRTTLGRAPLTFGLHGQMSSPVELHASQLQVTLRRYGAGGHLQVRALARQRLDLTLGVHVEAAFYTRHSRTASAELDPTPDALAISPVFGPHLELALPLSPRMALSLEIGASFIAYATRFQIEGTGEIEGSGEPREVARLSRVEPWLGLAFQFTNRAFFSVTR